MSSRETSVNLVIKARNEADRAINTVTTAVENLLNTTEQGGTKVAALTNALLSVDKAAATIATAADRGEAAFDKLGAQIIARRAELEGLQAEARSAASAMAQLNSAEAVIGAGRDQSGRLAQLKAAEAAYDSLQTKIQRLGQTLSTDETRLAGSRSALQQLSSTAIAAADGQARLRAEVQLETEALVAQAAAAERVTAIQARLNALTGVDRPATFDGSTASQSAAILAEVAARDNLIQTYREQAAEARALAAAEAAEAANRQRFGITDDPRGRDAAASAAVFEERARATEATVRAERDLDAAAAAVRAELNPQAMLQERFNQKLREAKDLFQQGKISASELTQRTAQLAQQLERAQVDMKRFGRGDGGAFGLRPYEITNLGYQVNDLVTQVASGTSVFQALAQQGGQILQILPGIGARLLAIATNPFFLVGAATVGAIVLGFKELADQNDRLRDFEATLTTLGNGADYSAEALERSVKAAQRYGTSAADATAALKLFVKEGIAPDRLDAFTRTAQNMADVLGIKVPDAAKQLADGFTGGYDAIVKLDEATGFLTQSQREQIRTLFEEGRAQEARAKAYAIFAGQQDEAADKARGPWADAVRELGNAWREFIGFLSENTIIQGAAEALADLGRTAARVIRELRGVKDLSDVAGEIARIDQIIENKRRAAAGNPNLRDELNRDIAELERLKRQKQSEYDRLQSGATPGEGGDTLAGNNAEAAKRRSDRLAEITRQQQLDQQKKLGDAARVRQAGELAFQAEMRKSGDAIIANAEKQLAVTREQAKVNEENAREAERRLREGATSLGASKNLIMDREKFAGRAYWDVNAYRVGYGSDTVTNPNGSVSRVTRNTTTTVDRATVDLERRIKEFQDVIKRQIGSDRFGAFNPQQQAALTSVAYNYGSLPQRIVDTVKTGTQDAIVTAIRGLGGDNKGVNRDRRNIEANLFGAAPNAEIAQFNADADQKRQERQDKYNQSIDDEIAKRTAAADALKVEGELSGNALLDAQKRREISNALADERRKARDAGVEEEDAEFQARLARLAEQLDREFELRNQKRRQQNAVDAVEKPVAELTQARDSLQGQITFYRDNGLSAQANELLPVLDGVNGKLREAIDNAIAFYQALNPNDNPLGLTEAQITTVVSRLEVARDTSREWGEVLGVSAQQIAQAFASQATAAFDRFAKAVAEGKNIFKASKDAFLDFAASFLRMIAQMILQQIAFNLVKGVLRSFGVTVGTNHTGGIAGFNRTESRTVDPAWFTNALRYHTGGIAGLKPNEVPAILERGEEVLTRGDSRHRANGGGKQGGGRGGAVKVVNVFDAASAVEEALRTPAGEQAVLNHVRNNPAAWKSAMDG